MREIFASFPDVSSDARQRAQFMDIFLPQTFSELVEEITKFTGLSRDEVEQRVWWEALQPGWNVAQDIKNFDVIPHKYDSRMERLYKEGNGFIFETLRFWAQPQRQNWIALATDRLRVYCSRHDIAPSHMRIVMLGDGTGSDSLYLANQGFHIDYFDVPGSRTMEFALKRFEHYGTLGTYIRPVADYSTCLAFQCDAVICFEVLEHLPQPLATISDMGRMLKTQGIALVTETFGTATDEVPTHLFSNQVYAGRTPFLFLKKDLFLSWYSNHPLFRPMEYVKLEKRSIGEWWHLMGDRRIVRAWSIAQARRVNRRARRLVL